MRFLHIFKGTLSGKSFHMHRSSLFAPSVKIRSIRISPCRGLREANTGSSPFPASPVLTSKVHNCAHRKTAAPRCRFSVSGPFGLFFIPGLCPRVSFIPDRRGPPAPTPAPPASPEAFHRRANFPCSGSFQIKARPPSGS